MRRALLFGTVVALLVALEAIGVGVPALSGRVNDLADLLPPEAESRVEAKLAAFEEQHGAQIAVLTVPTLDGEAIEDFSMRVVETWQLGRAEADDGVLLLVARDDRKMRIEVGYGLEAELTDAQSGRILDGILRPHFREGDFAGGVERGIDAILGTLQGLDVIPAEATATDLDQGPLSTRLGTSAFLFFMVWVFSAGALRSPGCTGLILYFFLMPFVAMAGAMIHPQAAIIALALWAVLFPIFLIAAKKRGWGQDGSSSTGGWWGGGFGGGGYSGGSFGGGFSGGGGSFGGGGASSSW